MDKSWHFPFEKTSKGPKGFLAKSRSSGVSKDMATTDHSATDIMYERIRDPAWLTGAGGPGQWSSGLCDCFGDCRLCIIMMIPVVDTFNVAQTVCAFTCSVFARAKESKIVGVWRQEQ